MTSIPSLQAVYKVLRSVSKTQLHPTMMCQTTSFPIQVILPL